MRIAFIVLLAASASAAEWPRDVRQHTIPIGFRVGDSAGGLIAADLDGDGRREVIVTAPGHVGAFRLDGKTLWRKEIDIRVSAGSSEGAGLPGHHGPAVQVADVDGDRRMEVLFLDQDDTVHVLDARTGKTERTIRFPHPKGAERWEHLVVANLRGKGDRDLLLQATNAKGYRMGRYVSAYAFETPEKPLWSTDRYVGCAHNGLRVADLDGDGRDEILGSTVISPDGALKVVFEHRGHLDSIFVADVRPDVPGLELVALEEGGGNRVFVFNGERVLWEAHADHQEPQNAALGEFDPQKPGLEVWCRSRYDTHQRPFLFDARGKLIRQYAMDDVAPKGWTEKGVEVIAPIHWTGGPAQLAAAKERHESGDVGLFEPVSGRFVLRLPEKADRIYVADVTGDWREEILVMAGEELHVYENRARNPRPREKRLWAQPHYARSKMTWNYYSP